jgi:hypothetical protein
MVRLSTLWIVAYSIWHLQVAHTVVVADLTNFLLLVVAIPLHGREINLQQGLQIIYNTSVTAPVEEVFVQTLLERFYRRVGAQEATHGDGVWIRWI